MLWGQGVRDLVGIQQSPPYSLYTGSKKNLSHLAFPIIRYRPIVCILWMTTKHSIAIALVNNVHFEWHSSSAIYLESIARLDISSRIKWCCIRIYRPICTRAYFNVQMMTISAVVNRGVHPPRDHDAFSPCFRFCPYFLKNVGLWRKFQKCYLFPNNFLISFSSAEISDDLFLVIDHKLWISP